MPRTTWLIAALFSGSLLVSAAPARADVVPPDECGDAKDRVLCEGKKAGDACTFANGTKGNCAKLRCTNDAGEALLQCVATGATGGGCSALPGDAGQAQGGALALLALALALFGVGRGRRDQRRGQVAQTSG